MLIEKKSNEIYKNKNISMKGLNKKQLWLLLKKNSKVLLENVFHIKKIFN